MKLFFLFVIAVIILLIVNPVDNLKVDEKNNNEPACCTKVKCSKKESISEQGDILPLQFNPIHI